MALPSEIKQWTTTQNGIRNLAQRTVDMPGVGAGEVLVKVLAVSLNYRDTEVCNGTYGHHASIPQGSSGLVPCSDMTGSIAISKSKLWKEGDRVLSIFNQTHLRGQVTEKDLGTGLGLPLPGVLATYRVFKAESLVRCPEYLTDEQASTLPIASVTAWTSINWDRPVGDWKKGEDVSIVCQGTGGVSIAGLQIAHACGMKTIVTSSSDDKLAKASSLGATRTINYKTTPDWEKPVFSYTNGEGATIILEAGGAQTLLKSFDCIAFGGTIAAIGYLSGKGDPAGGMNVNLLALKRNVTLKGILNGSKERFEEMLGLYEEKRIVPVVDRVFGFEEARDALLYLESGRHFGKVVIKVGDS